MFLIYRLYVFPKVIKSVVFAVKVQSRNFKIYEKMCVVISIRK